MGETLTLLARVTNELTSATSVEAVTKIVTQHMADAFGANIAALALLEGDAVRILAMRGISAPEAATWQVIPLERRTTVTDAARTGRRIVLVGADAIRRAYPDVPEVNRGERSTVTVPLRVAGRVRGVIHLSIPGVVEPDPGALEFLDVLADTCAQALERIEASEVAARQTARLAFLAEASIELASSLDLDVTATRVARLAVPDFADWCAIDVLRDGSLHRLAVAHVDPEKVELAMRLHERWPPDPASRVGPMEVVRTGEPLLIPEVTDDMLVASAHDDEHLAVARELGLRSALLVPLLVRRRPIGVLTWVSTADERRYDMDDLHFAEHLARRAATAIDNAELYSQTRAVAAELQRAVLPASVSGNPCWEVRHRYLPAGRTEVGGDFFDAFPLEDGRVVAFVGDVMGRGVAAAAAMAQMRAAIRAFVSIDPAPEVVVGKLDTMMRRYDAEQLVTLVCLLLDGSQGRVDVTNAGHVPPWILRADGSVEQLPFAEGPPLGLGEGRTTTQVRCGTGDTLLVVTDGLVERRGESLDAGLARLAAVLPVLGRPDLDVALGELVERLQDPGSDDDVAALALRRTSR